MNRAAGRGRVLRPAARSLRANASVTGPGRSHGRCQGPPPSGPAVGPARLGGGAGENGCRLQFVWELPGCPADSHDLRADIYVDHRMISTCIRFDSNRAVPYSPSRYPHGNAPRASPRLSDIQKHRSEFAVRGSVRASPFLSPPRQGLLEALPPALAADS
jgi:hypothetical protein